VTATPAAGRTMTAGHPPSYSTLRNARAAEWLAATREGRRRTDPDWCDDCRGFHLAGTTDTDTKTGD
jgi:hypothetical protein